MHGLVTGEDPRQRRGDLELKLENPLGFFESERLVEINDALLQVLGCQWDRPPLLPASWDQPPLFDALQPHRSRLASYALEQAWVDKDPRLCITYPAYFHILLRRIPLVVALREPLAVATSLHARNGFSLNRGLVLWWIYNHHIASQLGNEDLLVPYSILLNLDEQSLQRWLAPFLEQHQHARPSQDRARALIASLLRPEFNRAEAALGAESRARLNPLLLEVCERAYTRIAQDSDPLNVFREQFQGLPRAVLERLAHDQLLPEADAAELQIRLQRAEADLKNLRTSVEQRESDGASLQRQLADHEHALRLAQRQLVEIRNSRSWQITAPLRALGDRFRGRG